MTDPTDRSDPPEGYSVDFGGKRWSAEADGCSDCWHDTKAEATDAAWAHRDRIYQEGVREGEAKGFAHGLHHAKRLASKHADFYSGGYPESASAKDAAERIADMIDDDARDMNADSCLADHDAAVQRAKERETLETVMTKLETDFHQQEQQYHYAGGAAAWVRARLKELNDGK